MSVCLEVVVGSLDRAELKRPVGALLLRQVLRGLDVVDKRVSGLY